LPAPSVRDVVDRVRCGRRSVEHDVADERPLRKVRMPRLRSACGPVIRRTEVAVAVADADDGGVRAANRNDRWRGVREEGEPFDGNLAAHPDMEGCVDNS